MLRRVARSSVARTRLAGSVARRWASTYDPKRAVEQRWEEIFARDPSTLKEPAPSTIEPTVDEAFNTSEHPFVTDPLVAYMHRIREVLINDPRVQAYLDYLHEMDPKKAAEKEKLIEPHFPQKRDISDQELKELWERKYGFGSFEPDDEYLSNKYGKDWREHKL